MDKPVAQKNGKGGALCICYGVNSSTKMTKKKKKIIRKMIQLDKKRMQWLPAYLENSTGI